MRRPSRVQAGPRRCVRPPARPHRCAGRQVEIGLQDERAEVDRRVAQGPRSHPIRHNSCRLARSARFRPSTLVGDRRWSRCALRVLAARPTGSTTTSCGRPRRSSRARRRSVPGRDVDPCTGNAWMQRRLPPVESTDDVPRAPAVPAAAGDRAAAVRRDLGPRGRRPAVFAILARGRRRARLVDARPAAGPRRIRLATTMFFGFGTVFWYAAQLGTTWY